MPKPPFACSNLAVELYSEPSHRLLAPHAHPPELPAQPPPPVPGVHAPPHGRFALRVFPLGTQAAGYLVLGLNPASRHQRYLSATSNAIISRFDSLLLSEGALSPADSPVGGDLTGHTPDVSHAPIAVACRLSLPARSQSGGGRHSTPPDKGIMVVITPPIDVMRAKCARKGVTSS
jgi:hypothetical protein